MHRAPVVPQYRVADAIFGPGPNEARVGCVGPQFIEKCFAFWDRISDDVGKRPATEIKGRSSCHWMKPNKRVPGSLTRGNICRWNRARTQNVCAIEAGVMDRVSTFNFGLHSFVEFLIGGIHVAKQCDTARLRPLAHQ